MLSVHPGSSEWAAHETSSEGWLGTLRTAIAQAVPFRLANQDALGVYEVHQPLALTSLPGNSWQSP